MGVDPLLIGAGSGLLAGTLHALLGPDHLAAVLPLSMEQPGAGAWTGMRWGAGHAVGTWLLALIAAVGGHLLPLDLISGMAERLVGAALIGVGLWGMRAAYRHRLHTHQHVHDRQPLHRHFHLHDNGAHTAQAHLGHSHAAVSMGLLHGIAGAGPFVALLPAVVLPDHTQALVYVVAYGLGAMLAMAAFAYVVTRVAGRLGHGSGSAYRGALLAASGGAVCIGTVWLTL